MLEADDGRKRVRSEKGITATAWLSTAGVQLALLCFLLLIVGGAIDSPFRPTVTG